MIRRSTTATSRSSAIAARARPGTRRHQPPGARSYGSHQCFGGVGRKPLARRASAEVEGSPGRPRAAAAAPAEFPAPAEAMATRSVRPPSGARPDSESPAGRRATEALESRAEALITELTSLAQPRPGSPAARALQQERTPGPAADRTQSPEISVQEFLRKRLREPLMRAVSEALRESQRGHAAARLQAALPATRDL